MSGHTPGTGHFLNENGLVNEIFEDAGDISFDIFDAADWPGNDEQGKAYAALITRAVNCHDDMLEILKALIHGLPELLEQMGHTDEEGLIAKADAIVAKAGEQP